MSLYRNPSKRPVVAIGVSLLIGLVLGGVIGYLVAGAGEESPSLTQAIADVQADVRPAIDGIELVAVEYPIGVKDGQVVVPEQLQGAKDQLARVRETFDGAKADLTVLDPDATAKVATDLDQLQAQLEALAPEAEVAALVKTIEDDLRNAVQLA